MTLQNDIENRKFHIIDNQGIDDKCPYLYIVSVIGEPTRPEDLIIDMMYSFDVETYREIQAEILHDNIVTKQNEQTGISNILEEIDSNKSTQLALNQAIAYLRAKNYTKRVTILILKSKEKLDADEMLRRIKEKADFYLNDDHVIVVNK